MIQKLYAELRMHNNNALYFLFFTSCLAFKIVHLRKTKKTVATKVEYKKKKNFRCNIEPFFLVIYIFAHTL